MKCPECQIPLTRESLENIELDVCKGCEGIWFDSGELRRYREEKLLGNIRVGQEQATFVTTGGIGPKPCPRCDTQTLCFGTLGTFRTVAKCSGCQGIFAYDAKRLLVKEFLTLIASFAA